MDCIQVKQKLQEHIDDVLSECQMTEMKTHLLSCVSCRKTAEGLQTVVNTLSGLSHYRPGAKFSAKVLAAIELDEQQQTAAVKSHLWAILAERFGPGHRKFGYVFAFSAFAVLFLVDIAHGLGPAI